MRGKAAKAFDLDEESTDVRDAYGRNRFRPGLPARAAAGRAGCAVRRGHAWAASAASAGTRTSNNFEGVKQLSGMLDPAWATLMAELASRGLLETTTIVWMGEFGRTPKINGNTGRDHYPNAW